MGVTAGSRKNPRRSADSADDSTIGADAVDIGVLRELQSDGRITFAELGKRVNLSPAAVAERVRRLEADGVITGYVATVSPDRLGYPMSAFIRVSPHGGIGVDHPRTREVLARNEVREFHHVIGDDCWILRVVVAGTAHLEELIEAVAVLGRTTTSIVLSTPIHRDVLEPR